MGLLKKEGLHVANDMDKRKVRGEPAANTLKFQNPKHQIISIA